MKRFSIFCAALFAAATSFAAVTYELNGGVTNDDGWLNKNDMFQACMADCGVTDLLTLDEYKAMADPYTPICTKLTDVTGMMTADKWEWLELYIMTVQNADLTTPATQLEAGVTSAGWRYAVAAFFVETQRTGWPKSADFSGAGKDEAYIPAWKHAYANPTEPTAEWVLNAPYKEGETFDGWYASADFSGEKVTKIDATTTGTLYAKWVSYIPTIAEVRAFADDTETKATGVVNFISGKNVYIQDATGGLLLYTAEEPTCKVGDKIVVKGKKIIYGGAPELTGVVVESAEASVLATPSVLEGLSGLVGDVELKYFGTRVSVAGLTIKSYDSYNNPTLTDGTNEAVCYKMVLDPAVFAVGKKVSITAVAGWYNGFQFVGDAAGIELPVAGKVDTYAYPARHDGKYTLKNNWVISVVEDNYAANSPGKTDHVRGMAVKDGIMYFINRDTKSLVRVDGKTGNMLSPLPITGEHLFEREGDDGVWGSAATLAYNDIKFDQAGNCLIGSCNGGGGTFQIYLVDLETGAATTVVEERIYDNPDWTDNGYRFDAFGVYGDVTSNAVIMAADASGSWNVYRWLIYDGVAEPAEQISITLDAANDQSLFIDAAGFGTAPQIFPQDEVGSIFYVDGFNMLPMLFDETGMLLDDFIHVPTGVKITNKEGDECSMNQGHNGLVEFEVDGEYFLLMAATNTVGSPTSAFALYKFADEARAFEGMEPMWYFPANGMGSLTNGCRTAVPSVEVEGKVAKLYLYANNNGYACYTLTLGDAAAAVENVEVTKVGAEKVIENGQVYIIKNEVKYNVLGAEVK